MKVRMTVTLDVDVNEWMLAYGLERKDVREDVLGYVSNALWNMPVPPKSVVVR